MQSKVDGSKYPDRKMYYNSGHDNTVLCLEIALGLRSSELTQPVEVGSALVIELHQDSPSSKHYVRVSSWADIILCGTKVGSWTFITRCPLCWSTTWCVLFIYDQYYGLRAMFFFLLLWQLQNTAWISNCLPWCCLLFNLFYNYYCLKQRRIGQLAKAVCLLALRF